MSTTVRCPRQKRLIVDFSCTVRCDDSRQLVSYGRKLLCTVRAQKIYQKFKGRTFKFIVMNKKQLKITVERNSVKTI